MTNFPHLVSNPNILNGKPCIIGTRISVDLLLEWFASGATQDEIMINYPHLTKEAIQEALRYASYYLKNEILVDIQIS